MGDRLITDQGRLDFTFEEGAEYRWVSDGVRLADAREAGWYAVQHGGKDITRQRGASVLMIKGAAGRKRTKKKSEPETAEVETENVR